jgi:hypothetical protein
MEVICIKTVNEEPLLRDGWKWEGFLGGSLYNTKELALIAAGRKMNMYHVQVYYINKYHGFKIAIKPTW